MVHVTVRTYDYNRLVGYLAHRTFQVSYAETAIDKKSFFFSDEKITIRYAEIAYHIRVFGNFRHGIIGACNSVFHNSTFLIKQIQIEKIIIRKRKNIKSDFS